jgi:glycosyltransferase involved in cell wall biosynthesis
MHRLLADPDLARRMGAAGRERILREFTWDRVADHFLESLEERTGRLLSRRESRLVGKQGFDQ